MWKYAFKTWHIGRPFSQELLQTSMMIEGKFIEKAQEKCLNPILENVMLETQTRLVHICEKEIINWE